MSAPEQTRAENNAAGQDVPAEQVSGSAQQRPETDTLAPAGSNVADAECICRGNWRAIVKETERLIGKIFLDRGGVEYRFFGIVHGDDDYYYGMISVSEPYQLRLLSCVGSIENHSFMPAEQREIQRCTPQGHSPCVLVNGSAPAGTNNAGGTPGVLHGQVESPSVSNLPPAPNAAGQVSSPDIPARTGEGPVPAASPSAGRVEKSANWQDASAEAEKPASSHAAPADQGFLYEKGMVSMDAFDFPPNSNAAPQESGSSRPATGDVGVAPAVAAYKSLNDEPDFDVVAEFYKVFNATTREESVAQIHAFARRIRREASGEITSTRSHAAPAAPNSVNERRGLDKARAEDQINTVKRAETAEQLRSILESSLATAQRQLAESKHQTEGLAEVLKKIALEDPTADWAGKVAREALAALRGLERPSEGILRVAKRWALSTDPATTAEYDARTLSREILRLNGEKP